MKYLVIVFLFIACHNISPYKKTPKISMEKLDTISSAPGRIIAAPVLFESAFYKGTTQQVNKSTFNLYGITIGKLNVTSGRLIICDPMHIDEYGIPFTQQFPIGQFPVQLSIAKLGNEELCAFARINFSDEPVARWELALQKGQEPLPLDAKKFHGYGVDGSVGIFIDDAASKVLDQKEVADFNGAVFKEMEKHYHDTWKYTMYSFGTNNLAAFQTGLGDGHYGSYVGFDAANKPCRLLTDFGLFNWKEIK